MNWPQRPLREGLRRLSETYEVAIFLDRRVDPERAVTVSAQDVPLATLVDQIATQVDAKAAQLGPVVYVGPLDAAGKVATLAALRRQEFASLSRSVQTKLQSVQPMTWPELAKPSELVESLAREAGLSVVNREAIPLDLWPATSLPPLAWVDRLSLVLTGLDLTFEIDASSQELRLVPIPDEVVIERRYRPGGSAAVLLPQLRRALPEAKIRADGAQIVLAGRQEDHEKLERLLAGQSISAAKTTKPGGEKLYSLRVAGESSAGDVLQTVARSVGKELKYDASLLAKLKQPVTFDLKDATLDFLLETTLKPLGLKCDVTERELVVRPAP